MFEWEGRLIVHVDMNAFYPSCEQLVNPSLRGKPVIVIMTPEEGETITRGAVASCSYEARAFGVRSGMSYLKAKELCPDGIYLRTNFQLYEEISSRVMSHLEAFADRLEVASIDEAYIDSTRKAQEYNSPEELGKAIKLTIKEKVGLTCSVGIAPTKACAKIASDYRKPDGLTVVRPSQVKSFLAPLEVGRVAGIGPKTQAALAEMGIKLLGELAATPPYTLEERFGKVGVWMWLVANGLDNDPVEPQTEYKSISTEHTLERPTQDILLVGRALKPMVEELQARVSSLGLLYRTVGVKLVYNDFKITTRDHSFREPRGDTRSIEQAINLLLPRFDYTKPVRKVGLRLSNFIKIPGNQKTIETWMANTPS
ncbi:MAG: DNA polymerase IV [Thermoprotei archaeon]